MAKKKFRPEQEQIISGYTQGRVGIAAVPGSGKTFTLAHLAARLVATQIDLAQEQEVLIVTFTNTAVNSFRKRIDRVLSEDFHLIPYVGYRVRTLHGLAHDIVRERPALVGLADDFIILDEKLVLEIQRDLVAQHLDDWWDRLGAYANPDVSNPRTLRHNFEQDLPELVTRFIQRAKDMRRTPDELYLAVQGTNSRFDLARFAISVYMDYQRSLAYRGAVDFDDLVRLALQTLDLDDHYLRRLQDRWPYILEDEAQDSSRLQEDMLSCLSSRHGNWVRVGDPNQAINTTFTTASPFFLLDFLNTAGVVERPLSVSGRSAPSILAAANKLVRWTVEEHPTPDLRDAFDLQDDPGIRRGVIKPTPKRDPQPNPPDDSCFIHIEYRPDQKVRPEKELEMIVSGEEYSLLSWLHEIEQLPEDERPTVAVLVPENSRGFKLAEMLRKYNIRYEELLRSTTATRQTVTALRLILEYLSDPTDLKTLKQLFWVLMSEVHRDQVKEDADLRQSITRTFADFKNLEEFLWPTTRVEIGEHLTSYQSVVAELEEFRVQVRRWLQAVILPVDQLVLTISQDRFTDPVDVALGYKVAVLLGDMADSHPDWRLPQFVEELRIISNNERKFIGFDDADAGYEPKPGVVTIATMHAAKGLEWDRVYLMAVSNYGFPAALPYDFYIGERWYVRDKLNLEAEILAQLHALINNQLFSYAEGSASLVARLDYAKERLRLLYVGMTRAKRELIVTWNMGRFWQNGKENQPALPMIMLGDFIVRNKV